MSDGLYLFLWPGKLVSSSWAAVQGLLLGWLASFPHSKQHALLSALVPFVPLKSTGWWRGRPRQILHTQWLCVTVENTELKKCPICHPGSTQLQVLSQTIWSFQPIQGLKWSCQTRFNSISLVRFKTYFPALILVCLGRPLNNFDQKVKISYHM